MTRAIVVDDNVELASNVAELLEMIDVEVAIAHDSDEAIRLAQGRDLDLAIVDVRLPRGASGVELVPRLRAASPNVEIIIVTGNATVDSAVAAVRHGIFAYVQKPFDSSDLLAIARRALDQTRVRRERERLAIELASSEAMYRNLVDTIDTAIVLLDPHGVVRFANRFARALVTDAMPIEGAAFVDVFATADVAARVARALEPSTRQPMSFETLLLRPAGTRTLRWTFIQPTARDSRQFLVVGVDLTEVRDLQRRTVEAEALAAVGALTTGLAHEIRNPLNAASLQLELLVRGARKVEDTKLRESMEDRVRIVRGELGRLERMLHDFLSLARPRGLDLEVVDLSTLLHDVVELQTPVAEQQGASLVHQGSEATIRVQIDTNRIKQVLINLVTNALDALRPSGAGRVTLSAHLVEAGWAEILVTDDGPGIETGADEVFRPFVTTKEGGTGLGLSIVRTIIERHGGTVTLSSAPRGSCGTVARFTVPTALGAES